MKLTASYVCVKKFNSETGLVCFTGEDWGKQNNALSEDRFLSPEGQSSRPTYIKHPVLL